MRLELLEEVGSTNEYIRRYLAGGEDIAVCARRQTGGKGTKGRSFLSDDGGVYFSVLRFFRDLPAREAFRIMQHAAVAVCLTAEEYGVSTRIKWPNDVLVNGKKLAGILIENAFSGGYVKSSIVGIGLNACNDLRALAGVAVSLSEAAGRSVCAEDARDKLFRNFCVTGLSESEALYEGRLLLGKFLVVTAEESYLAELKRVLPDGRLEAERGGERVILSAAEVSLR